jgi:hypothetical protein
MKISNPMIVTLLLVLSSCEGCKKDEPKPKTELEKLPPATQEGKNTFGCLVNGKAFVPATSIDAGAVYQLGILQIYATIYKPYLQFGMVILEKNYGQLTTTAYQLNRFPDSSCSATSQDVICDYNPQECIRGSIVLTKIDRVNYVISGTFDFILAKTSCDTLNITSGRFDIRYIP